ncbi:MAG: Holliday junction resolvase RuvX [Bacteroidota bacterium]|nr:Holliday junction resolvase RuvX [Candidatus Kapabacteria bacterium]MDW8221069.1 Holliday junction resolvase RuvX [Bacteroidota bacterium]
MLVHPVEITSQLRVELRGKRIGALDYGQKRIGFAVADELHILATPRGFFLNGQLDVLKREMQRTFDYERLGAVIVGMPFQCDNSETPIMREIQHFIAFLRTWCDLPIFVVDEAYSSQEARAILMHTGARKKERSAKGRTDEVAAALILQEFLRELE